MSSGVAVAERSVALDVFRGLTIAFMVLVNNPGAASYPPLRHADWHGWTPTDLVFPFFVFIVGAAIPYSLSARARKGGGRGAFVLRLVRRAAILFALGLLLAGFPRFDFSTIRIPGVLQRIALSWLLATLVCARAGPRARLAVAGILLVAHTALLTLVPVPGVGPPSLGKDTNLGAWLDRQLLDGHLWKQSKTWDPEGVLGTLTAVATALLGAAAGDVARRVSGPRRRAAVLASGGALLLLLSVPAATVIPVNKPLWTASYVLLSGGFAALLLALLGVACDGPRPRPLRIALVPFVALGRNAILVFVLSGLLAKTLSLITVAGAGGRPISLRASLYRSAFAPIFATPEPASLLFALTHVLVFTVLAILLHRFRLYLRV